MSAVVQHAFRLADSAARSDIEVYCVGSSEKGYDTNADAIGRFDREAVQDAIAYLDLRGKDLPFQFIRDPTRPHIVKFRNRP